MAGSPDPATAADRWSPFPAAPETFGRATWHGQVTVPQHGIQRLVRRAFLRVPNYRTRAASVDVDPGGQAVGVHRIFDVLIAIFIDAANEVRHDRFAEFTGR